MLSKFDFNLIKIIVCSGVPGVIALHKSLNKYKLYRLIKDTATSKIKTAALGNHVELNGSIISHNNELIVSPLAQKKCAYFIWDIYVYENRRKRGEWVHIHKTYSSSYLLIKDDSQEVAAISMEKVDESFVEDQTKKFRFSSLEDLPESMSDFYKKKIFSKVFRKHFGVFNRSYQVIEKIIRPGDNIFVIGYAKGPKKIKLIKPTSKKSFYDKSLSIEEDSSLKTEREEFLYLKNKLNEIRDSSSLYITATLKDSWRLFQINKVYITMKSEDDFITVGKQFAFLGLAFGILTLTVSLATLIYFISRFF